MHAGLAAEQQQQEDLTGQLATEVAANSHVAMRNLWKLACLQVDCFNAFPPHGQIFCAFVRKNACASSEFKPALLTVYACIVMGSTGIPGCDCLLVFSVSPECACQQAVDKVCPIILLRITCCTKECLA